jgi:hypothetical protein
MIWLASALKLLTEIALMALVGRALLGLLAGAGASGNAFWRLLDVVVQPCFRATAWLGRGRWTAARVQAVTALALFLLWLLATTLKVSACLSAGPGACR